MSVGLMISLWDYTVLDWIVLGVLLYSVVTSALRGFAREVIGLVTLSAAMLLAFWFHRGVAALFKDVVKTENLALFSGFFLIFVATIFAGFLIMWIVAKFVKFAGVQWFDRVLGAAFGLVRGWLIGAVVFLGLTSFGVQFDMVRNSQFAPYFLPGSRVIAVVAPFELKAKFLLGYRDVERWWREH